MKKKLSRRGNGYAVILDKPMLDLLEINEKTTVKIRTDGKNIIIEPLKGINYLVSKDSKLKAHSKILYVHMKTLLEVFLNCKLYGYH